MADPRPSPRAVSAPIAERIRQVVARMTGRTPITDRMGLSTELRLDAADTAELIAAVELACRIDLPPEEADRVATVGDLIGVMEAKQAIAATALLEAIEDLAAGAAARGRPVDIATAARVLAGEHSAAWLDIEAVEAAIGRAIAARMTDSQRKS